MNHAQKYLAIGLLGVASFLILFSAAIQNFLSIEKSYRQNLYISRFVEIKVSSSNNSRLGATIETSDLQGLNGVLAVIMEEDKRNALLVADFDQDLVLNISTAYQPMYLDWCTQHLIAISSIEGNIYVVDLINATSVLVYDAKRLEAAATNVSCSPSGRQIAFSSLRDGKSNIYILNLESQKIVQYTDAPVAAYAPSWSPDGNRLIYVSMVDDDNIFTRYPNVELTQGNLDSTDRDVLYEGVTVSSPVWSQDNEIAFSAYINPNVTHSLYLLNLDSRTIKKLAGDLFNSYFTSEVFFTWSKNPRYAMFLADDGGGYSLYLLDFDTKTLNVVLNEAENFIDMDWN